MQILTKLWVSLSLFLISIQSPAFAIRNFGEQNTIKTDACIFEGSYTPNTSYDVKASISNLKIEQVEPSLFKFTIQFRHLEVGNFFGISFYDPDDKEHVPIKDLSYTGQEKDIDESSFVQFKAFPGRGNKVSLSPVVYKEAYRGDKDGKEIFITPFGKKFAIVDEYDNPVGGGESFFTNLIVKMGGRGTYHAEYEKKNLHSNSKGEYTFLLYANPKYAKEIFMIVAITKISVMSSGRGLRSPIITTPFNLTENCN